MIIVITCEEIDEITERRRIIASHGYDTIRDKNVVLPGEEPYKLGAVFDKSIGEWVIYEKNSNF
jgi:hypothetical protein